MDIADILFYMGIGIGNLLILTEWAKKGFWEVGLEGLKNKKAISGWVIGVGTFTIAGIMYRLNGFNPLNNNYAVALVFTIPILIAFLARITMPPGQRKFDVAKTRMNFWMNPKYYQAGRILESGNDLREFPKAQQTAKMFQEAIIPFQTDTSLQGRLNQSIGYGELGMMYRLMNMWEEAEDFHKRSLLLYMELKKDYPNNSEVGAGLSMVHFRKAEIAHARRSFEKAIEEYQKSLQEGADTNTERDIHFTNDLIKKAKMHQN